MWTPFCWPTLKRHKRDQCKLFAIDSWEERSKHGEVLGVPSQSEASPELLLSSWMCNECEFYGADSDDDLCLPLASMVSSLVVVSCGAEKCVEEWCQSDRAKSSSRWRLDLGKNGATGRPATTHGVKVCGTRSGRA